MFHCFRGDRPLSAPLNIGFDYTRSLGPVLGRFMTALPSGGSSARAARTAGCTYRRVEYDPVTHAALTELVEVSSVGTVLTWTWLARPLAGQPLTRPFAWALILLDGADTPMLHAVDVPAHGGGAHAARGMRVRVRWAAEPGRPHPRHRVLRAVRRPAPPGDARRHDGRRCRRAGSSRSP